MFIPGEKAHQCEECGKCFRRHDHLTVHYKSVHLGEKVWQKYVTQITGLVCVDTVIAVIFPPAATSMVNLEVWQNSCFLFSVNVNSFLSFFLRYKTAVHQCEVCKKEFKGKSSLEMHFRTHSGKETKNKKIGSFIL